MYEILKSIERVIDHGSGKSLSYDNISEEIFFKNDRNEFKLPFYSKNLIVSKSSEIKVKDKLELIETPSSLLMNEYAEFFTECMADSCCSDQGESFGMNCQNLVVDVKRENKLFYDGLMTWIWKKGIQIFYPRWENDICGLVSSDFEGLLARTMSQF